jgi:cytochrome oxidase Cu insertion factor (SCO1/SenC/PrrC family)
MSIDAETFVRYARAEKDLCQKASAVLTQIIKEIEDTHGIRIAEVRVTMDPSDSANGWSAANCVMVKGEHQDFGSDKADLDVEHSASSRAIAEHCFIAKAIEGDSV